MIGSNIYPILLAKSTSSLASINAKMYVWCKYSMPHKKRALREAGAHTLLCCCVTQYFSYTSLHIHSLIPRISLYSRFVCLCQHRRPPSQHCHLFTPPPRNPFLNLLHRKCSLFRHIYERTRILLRTPQNFGRPVWKVQSAGPHRVRTNEPSYINLYIHYGVLRRNSYGVR